MKNKMDELFHERWQQFFKLKTIQKNLGWINFMFVYFEKYNK
jgi:hypothetical protein